MAAWRKRLAGFLAAHARALVGALGRLYRAPLPSLLTAGVIGISLALPTGFLLLLANVGNLAGDWDSGPRLSLFVRKEVAAERYRALARELAADPQIRLTRVIAPEEALAEFRRASGFDDVLELLDDNPLPPVIVIEPRAELDPERLESLAARLRALPQVALVQLDSAWVQRLHAFLKLLRRGIWVVTGLLAVAVILVVGNTIRLDFLNRREEIVLIKLIGGTDAFIRRPFLYEGLWYGVAGALLAAVLVEAARLLLAGPARELAALYGSGYSLGGLGFDGLGKLLLTGAALGLLGAWLAVGRHLASIEPR